MIRVYDTNALCQYEEILRIWDMEAEIAVMQKAIADLECIERTKK